MEEKIRKLDAELHNKPDDFQLSVARRQAPTYKSVVKRSSPGEFLTTPQSVKTPSHEQASLEVLVAENDTSGTFGSDHYTTSHSTSIHQQTHQQTPERLRMRYVPLVKTLEKVCRETLSNYNVWPGDRDIPANHSKGAPTVLLRPWKLLVVYEKEIRDSIHDIDGLWEPARREDVSGGAAEMRVVEDCKYHPSYLVLVKSYAPHGLKGSGLLQMSFLTLCLGFSRIQPRRSASGTETAGEFSRRGPQADFRSA